MSTATSSRAANGAGSPQTFAGLSDRVDGKWVDAASGETFATLNPATEESLGSGAHGAAQDNELAVGAARRCFDDERSDWRRMTPSERGVVREEIFGPVVCAIPFDSEDDVSQSGNGGREMGHNALENYLETKSVVAQLA
ncbi:hypothetical protein AYO39_01700 [Actinobacteria bacterium SCGC AG-212-D09]|nr:hypothetical protein AYO39_01700 [Actinobacteria bacterium SCGC AG-212-D09]